jgi:hypothetical protein
LIAPAITNGVGRPGSGRLARSSRESRSSATSAPPSAAQKSGPSGQHELCRHLHRREVDDGRRAPVPGRLSEVEREEPAPPAVVRETVRMVSDCDVSQGPLVREREHAHARGAAVACEQAVVLLVDEHARDTVEIVQRAQVLDPVAVDHVHAVGAGVRDVQSPAARGDGRVSKPGRAPGGTVTNPTSTSVMRARPRSCTRRTARHTPAG